MSFVVAAYLVVGALFAVYVLSLAARQRLITDLADAASTSAAPPGSPTSPGR